MTLVLCPDSSGFTVSKKQLWFFFFPFEWHCHRAWLLNLLLEMIKKSKSYKEKVFLVLPSLGLTWLGHSLEENGVQEESNHRPHTNLLAAPSRLEKLVSIGCWGQQHSGLITPCCVLCSELPTLHPAVFHTRSSLPTAHFTVKSSYLLRCLCVCLWWLALDFVLISFYAVMKHYDQTPWGGIYLAYTSTL
jgi:hypothetical protein